MQIEILAYISEAPDHMNAMVFFSDGVVAVMEEKGYVEIGADGHVQCKAWKEEPCSSYYKLIREHEGPTGAVDRRSSRWVSGFSSLCFALTRKPGVVQDAYQH